MMTIVAMILSHLGKLETEGAWVLVVGDIWIASMICKAMITIFG